MSKKPKALMGEPYQKKEERTRLTSNFLVARPDVKKQCPEISATKRLEK